MTWFWLAGTVVALVAFAASFTDGRRKAERIGELESELEQAHAQLETVRSELRKSKRPSHALSELRELFGEPSD